MSHMIRTLLLSSLILGLSTSIAGCQKLRDFLEQAHEHHHPRHDAGVGAMDAGPIRDAGAVDTIGEDAGELTACGGLLGLTCDVGEYCKHALEAECGAADQTGYCVDIPEVCTLDYDPVCGCDGITYSNDCIAAAAGVSIASLGACVPL